MKKIFISFLFLISIFAHAQNTVVVDKDGSLLFPSKSDFVEKNDILSTSTLSVFIDTYRDGMDDIGGNRHTYSQVQSAYWTDCELKVLDENGNMLYFFSTIMFSSKKVQALHDDSLNDNNAIVYYYISGEGENSVCVKPKKLFPSSLYNSSIGATENAYNGITSVSDNKVRITGIQIYPSAEFLSVFLNPKNSIMIWRQSVSSAEVDGNNQKLWRPALIQYTR